MALLDLLVNMGTEAGTTPRFDRRTFFQKTVGLAALATLGESCESNDELVLKSPPDTKKQTIEKPTIDYISLPSQLQTVYLNLKARNLLPTLEAMLPEYNGFDLIAKKEAVFTAHRFTSPSSEIEFREIQALTHLFWVEQNSVVPWSVGHYNATEMFGLTTSDSSKYGIITPLQNSVTYQYAKMRSEVDKVFPVTMQVLKDAKVTTPTEAISAIVEWAEKNFFHQYSGWPSAPYQYASADTYDTSIEDIFKDRGLGCHLASMVVATMLRSVNVPADYILDPLLHGSAYFPTTKQFVHGDFIAMYAAMPADQIVMNEKDWAYWTQQSGTGGSYDKFRYAQYPKESVLSNPSIERNKEGLYVVGGATLQHHPLQADLDYFATKLPEFKIKFVPSPGYLGTEGWGNLVGKGFVPVEELK